MIAKTTTCSLMGIDASLVEVEVDISPGLPSYSTVGLPDNIVRESRERVKSALQNSGYRFPAERLIVNLAPAHLRKEGPGFDLPIAVGILAALGIVKPESLKGLVLAGELSLDGRVKPIRGGLPMALQVRESGYAALILPEENAAEAAVVGDVAVYPVDHLSRVVDFLNGRADIPPVKCRREEVWTLRKMAYELDFDEVKGQEHARRGLEVAAAGGHNALTLYGF